MFPGMMTAFGTFLMKQFFETVPERFPRSRADRRAQRVRDLVAIAHAAGDAGALGARDLHLPEQLDGVHLAADRHHQQANSTRCPSASRASRSSSTIQWEMIMTGAALATLADPDRVPGAAALHRARRHAGRAEGLSHDARPRPADTHASFPIRSTRRPCCGRSSTARRPIMSRASAPSTAPIS